MGILYARILSVVQLHSQVALLLALLAIGVGVADEVAEPTVEEVPVVACLFHNGGRCGGAAVTDDNKLEVRTSPRRVDFLLHMEGIWSEYPIEEDI
jgi:hypothetical protein